MIDMAVWKFKGCPRCGGDMFLSSDMDGWFEMCLQCSHRGELKDIAEFMNWPARKEKEPAVVRRDVKFFDEKDES